MPLAAPVMAAAAPRIAVIPCQLRRKDRNQKAGPRPAVLGEVVALEVTKPEVVKPEVVKLAFGCPGGAGLHPGRKSLLGLLGFLCLLRLFRLLRFLSHSILIWVNGWKRDTRHARRRANLAISSTTIPTDSRSNAPHR